ncbi:signal transduction histidine kinase [Pseudonocardia eucalypti]|uniref:histidine kinase n=1 Tax=Pseudonocardia eucalypti TaxID=648755 RepID=UPI0016168B77|nr:signal transduction histidine kinase [Pseudonocardia eucalypti]
MRLKLRAPVVGYGWVRLLPLLGVVGALALLHVPQLRPTGQDWAVALLAAAGILLGGRFPLAVSLGESALFAYCGLVADPQQPDIGSGLVRLMACVALGELAYRRRRPWQLWLGAAAVTTASALSPYQLYPAAANVMMVITDVGLPVLLGSFLRSRTELARVAEQRAVESERTRGWEVAAARTSERAAIARELHDVVAHHVASIVLRAGVARHVARDGDPRLVEALDDVHAIGGEALTDLRRLVGLLRDPDSVTDPGLLAATDLDAALTGVLDRTRQAGVRVEATLDGDALRELGTMHRHAVLRVVQEGLTNVIKHAGPGAAASVAARRTGSDALLVEVTDGGPTHPQPPSEPGHGLTVMRERVELLGGALRAGPREDGRGGWALRAELPGALAAASPAAASPAASPAER